MRSTVLQGKTKRTDDSKQMIPTRLIMHGIVPNRPKKSLSNCDTIERRTNYAAVAKLTRVSLALR
jgi:hypothetical protein